MSIEITYDEAVDLLKRAVEEKGAGTRDLPRRYFYVDDSPCCIVGQVLAAKGVQALDIESLNLQYAPPAKLVWRGVFDTDDRTINLLCEVQFDQDNDYTWGEALVRAGIA